MSKNILKKEKYILYHKNNIAVNTQFQMSLEREKMGKIFNLTFFKISQVFFEPGKFHRAKKREFRKVNFIY